MEHIGPVISRHADALHGLKHLKTAYWNLPTALLYEQALRRDEGLLARGGAFVAMTGDHTGRSPNDKFIVQRKIRSIGAKSMCQWRQKHSKAFWQKPGRSYKGVISLSGMFMRAQILTIA